MTTAAEANISKLLAGRRAIGRFPFPGAPEVECGVRLLTDREITEAEEDAQVYLAERCKRIKVDVARYIDIEPRALDREYERQIIFRAFVDPDSPPEKPDAFFAGLEKIRDLDAVILQGLWQIYSDWQDAVDPRQRLDEEQFEAVVHALKKGPTDPVLLGHLQPDTLRRLVRTMASRLPS